MDWKLILVIADAVISIIIFFAVAYYKRSSVLRGFIAELIKDAEEKFSEQEKAGSIKMSWVLDQLYAYVPAVFKPILTREALQTFVQYVFDQISAYADIQVAKLREKYEAEIEERVNRARIEVINKEALAEREAQTFRKTEKTEPLADAGTRTVVAKKASKKAK